MGMLVGQLIKILEQFDQDREVMIHTLIAKCSLEDYLKRKHGDSFRQLIITRCVPDYFGGANIFNNLFYGRQF